MNKIFYHMVFVVILLFLAGCSTSKLSLPSTFKTQLNKPIVAFGLANMPKDASRVVLAISAKILKSQKKINDVVFRSKFTSPLIDAELFHFSNSVLILEKGDMKNRILNADLFFKDSIGRSVAYSIKTKYSIKRNKIIILSLRIYDKFTNAKDTACFILPTKKYINFSGKNLPRNFYKLYRYAAINAITPEQAYRYRGKSKWTIIVFILNRLSNSAQITLGISDNKNSSDLEYKNYTKYINYNGWRVGIISGNFHLLQPDSLRALYAKVIFKPGKESSESIFLKKAKPIGIYRIK